MFNLGLEAYSNESKIKVLKISRKIIKKYGAVSEQVCRSMTKNVSKIAKTNMSISITGVAGPGGGTMEKPVGLVHLACAKRGGKTRHRAEHYGNLGRSGIREATIRTAIEMLMEQLA